MPFQPRIAKVGPRLPEVLRRELQGLDWAIENGGKHWKLKVNGRLAAVWPKGSRGKMANPHALANTLACIRRAAREV